MKYDLKLLDDYVAQGLLRKAEAEDLVQYNYSEKTNNEGLWDEVTMFNRGNVYEKKTGLLIAKAMPKFMNLSQLPWYKQQELVKKPKFNLTEKMDGCLGIIYTYKGELRCNSRGSFDNYVTDAIKRLIPKYTMVKTMATHNTLNVEVICPETKIICDYADTQELYLITAFGCQSNFVEHDYDALITLSQIMRMPLVKERHMSWEALLRWQKEADWTTEGFVVRFPDNERVKIKSEDYLRIAAFKQHLNKRSLWKQWRHGYKQRDKEDRLKQFMDSCPDELYATAQQLYKELLLDMEYHKQQVYNLWKTLKDKSKKELGLYFKENPNKYQAAIFSLAIGREIEPCLIDFIEPNEEFNGEDYVE